MMWWLWFFPVRVLAPNVIRLEPLVPHILPARHVPVPMKRMIPNRHKPFCKPSRSSVHYLQTF